MIERPHRVAIDTNVFVSAALRPNSLPDRAIIRAIAVDAVLMSRETIEELEEVLQRPKFDRVSIPRLRQAFISRYTGRFERVNVSALVADCRDPKDNKILALALSGGADFIITGDSDLLALHPWRGIGILSPADYLALSE